MDTRTLTQLLRLDAAANLVGGVALVAASGWLAPALGLASTWPLWLVGIVFLVNGTENELVARRTTTRGLSGLATADLVFAIALFVVAVADPTGAQPWTRWAMAGLATVTVTVAVAKTAGLRAMSGASTRPATP